MPPGQPVCRCEGCELLRPCKEWDGRWLCVDCCPVQYRVDGAGNELEPTAATDGGRPE